MCFDNDILTFSEKIIFDMRTLYSRAGFSPFKVSRFEEYELYAANRAFLPCDDIIAFTDASGRLMALRPDVTLSVIKSIRSDNEINKLYYNENVYRTVAGEPKEQMQVGLECIGPIDTAHVAEVIMLAGQSLSMLSKKARLDISHMGFLSGLINSEKLSTAQKTDIIKCISEKNTSDLRNICETAGVSKLYIKHLETLTVLSGRIADIKDDLKKISINAETDEALNQLINLDNALKKLDIDIDIFADFSVINDITYYNGIIFQGFIEGIPEKVLSGGRYDELLRSFNNKGGAVGFAINVDIAVGTQPSVMSRADKVLGIALPKGRLGEKALELFEKAGYKYPDIDDNDRRLVIEDPEHNVRYFWVKPSDVDIYVERGAADIGIVGKDTLLESGSDVYELLDLRLGKCRMCLAAEIGKYNDNRERELRVATKFPNIARRYFSGKGRDIDIITLHGSIELAPPLGLSDVIVDLVETGTTLRENNMETVETIGNISARLISNKVSYRFNHERIRTLCDDIAKYIE